MIIMISCPVISLANIMITMTPPSVIVHIAEAFLISWPIAVFDLAHHESLFAVSARCSAFHAPSFA